MKKVVSLLLAGIMAAGALTGCGLNGAGENSGENASAIKIGGIGPLTGAAAIYGNAAKNGAEIAVEEINAKGDLQFALKYEDDENDAEKSVNAYNNLKDWGMQVSLGSVTTQPCIAVSSEVYSDRVFALTPSASSPDVIKGKDNMFQMCFSDPNQGIGFRKIY